MSHLVLGELCADIVVALAADPVFGQTESLVPSTTITMGSSSAITACGLARLGVTTTLVSVAGDDVLGRFLLEELRARDVQTDHIRIDSSRPTGSSTILTRPDGDRAILTALGSIGQVRVDDVPAALLETVSHVHVGAYFLQYQLQDSLPQWFAALRARGITTSLDPNFDPAQAWDSGILEAIGQTDIFFCNDDEATAITGADGAEAVHALTRQLPDDGLLVVKRGADGARAHGSGGVRAEVRPPPDDRPLVDTVGAGDSLTAGFLAARAHGWDLPSALRAGVRNATASTRGVGGTSAQLTWEALVAEAERT